MDETPNSPRAIVARGLTKTYGDFTAVDGIDLDVFTGETFGFLGPNGAGKSTTIKMLCTLTAPSAGTATVAGHDIVAQRTDVRRHIGLVFQDTTLDGYLSAEQNLRFHGELYGIPHHQLDDRMRAVLDMVGLWERRGDKVQNFSGGMKRRLEIARGLMHSPRVLFLDEPTVGLDPQTRSSIWAYIHELRRAEKITIFLTTHYMDEAEHCDRIAIMDSGKVVVLDTPTALKSTVGVDRVRLHTTDDAAAIAALASQCQIDATPLPDGGIEFGVADGERFVPTLFSKLDLGIRSVSVTRPSLDDVFMSYTGRTIRDSEASATDRNRVFTAGFRR
jgi:ABC-2 type transport system ATP-binding protein